jgi:hypothetical protein
MIFGDRVAKTKLVEQLTLVTLQTAHHESTSPRFASTQRNHASWPLSTDFCNKICQEETLRGYPERAIWSLMRLSVLAGLAVTTSFGASTIPGSRIVKVNPRPGSPWTLMSPPII